MGPRREPPLPPGTESSNGALSLFSERGTTAVSMRELAHAAGVTVPGLYYHFASKAELVRAVYRERIEREPWGVPDPAPIHRLIVEQASREFRASSTTTTSCA